MLSLATDVMPLCSAQKGAFTGVNIFECQNIRVFLHFVLVMNCVMKRCVADS